MRATLAGTLILATLWAGALRAEAATFSGSTSEAGLVRVRAEKQNAREISIVYRARCRGGGVVRGAARSSKPFDHGRGASRGERSQKVRVGRRPARQRLSISARRVAGTWSGRARVRVTVGKGPRARRCITSVMTWTAQPIAASLSMTSDPGDPIADGRSYRFRGRRFRYPRQPGAAAIANVRGLLFDFRPPRGRRLTVGRYEAAPRPIGSGDNEPAMEITSGTGCNESIGDFDVLEVGYDRRGSVKVFDAAFEYYCERGAEGLRGRITWRR